MTDHHDHTHPDYQVPSGLAGGNLLTAWQALFDAAHERDAGEWAMPCMLAMVTAERLGDAPPTTEPGHEDHDHGAWVMAAMVAERATQGFNSGGALAEVLHGFAGAILTMPRGMVLPWLGLGPRTRVVGAAVLTELWTVAIDSDDLDAEAEFYAFADAGGKVSEYPGAVEMRALVGVDLFGYMYRLRQVRGEDHAHYKAIPLPGLGDNPGSPEDMREVDTILEPAEFRGVGAVLAALARVTSPEEGDDA